MRSVLDVLKGTGAFWDTFGAQRCPSSLMDIRYVGNSLSEHSVAGVPVSLYNLTKSVPDPYISTNMKHFYKFAA